MKQGLLPFFVTFILTVALPMAISQAGNDEPVSLEEAAKQIEALNTLWIASLKDAKVGDTRLYEFEMPIQFTPETEGGTPIDYVIRGEFKDTVTDKTDTDCKAERKVVFEDAKTLEELGIPLPGILTMKEFTQPLTPLMKTIPDSTFRIHITEEPETIQVGDVTMDATKVTVDCVSKEGEAERTIIMPATSPRTTALD